jgi:hypothetical protein
MLIFIVERRAPDAVPPGTGAAVAVVCGRAAGTLEAPELAQPVNASAAHALAARNLMVMVSTRKGPE